MMRNEPANEENAWVCFWNFVTKLGHVIPYHTIPYRTVPYRTVPYYLHFFLQFICCTRKWYLGELGRNLPKNVLDKSWLAPPPAVKEVRTVSKLSTPHLITTHHVTNSAYISFLISYLNFIKGIRFASRLIFSYYGQEICAWFVS